MKTRYELDPKIYHSYEFHQTNFARYQHIKMINDKFYWTNTNEPLQYNLNKNVYLWKENCNCICKNDLDPIPSIILECKNDWRI